MNYPQTVIYNIDTRGGQANAGSINGDWNRRPPHSPPVAPSTPFGQHWTNNGHLDRNFNARGGQEEDVAMLNNNRPRSQQFGWNQGPSPLFGPLWGNPQDPNVAFPTPAHFTSVSTGLPQPSATPISPILPRAIANDRQNAPPVEDGFAPGVDKLALQSHPRIFREYSLSTVLCILSSVKDVSSASSMTVLRSVATSVLDIVQKVAEMEDSPQLLNDLVRLIIELVLVVIDVSGRPKWKSAATFSEQLHRLERELDEIALLVEGMIRRSWIRRVLRFSNRTDGGKIKRYRDKILGFISMFKQLFLGPET